MPKLIDPIGAPAAAPETIYSKYGRGAVARNPLVDLVARAMAVVKRPAPPHALAASALVPATAASYMMDELWTRILPPQIAPFFRDRQIATAQGALGTGNDVWVDRVQASIAALKEQRREDAMALPAPFNEAVPAARAPGGPFQ